MCVRFLITDRKFVCPAEVDSSRSSRRRGTTCSIGPLISVRASYTIDHGAFRVESVQRWSPTRLADTGVLANLDLDGRHNRFLGLVDASGKTQDAAHQATFIFAFQESVRNELSTNSR